MEMSNLYFRLSYPMVEGSYGNMVTVVAPMDEKGKIYLDKAMFGDTKRNSSFTNRNDDREEWKAL